MYKKSLINVGGIIPMKSKQLRNDGCLTKDKSHVPSECKTSRSALL